MKVCSESEFKNSSRGSSIISNIKKYYSTPDRPIVDNYFTTSFLKVFYSQSVTQIDESIFNCYESLLEFFANERYKALSNEAKLTKNNLEYEAWLKANKNPVEIFMDIIKSFPLVLTLIVAIILLKK